MKKYELSIIQRLMKTGRKNKGETFYHNHKVNIAGTTYNMFICDYYFLGSAQDDYGYTEYNDSYIDKLIKDHLSKKYYDYENCKHTKLMLDKDSIEAVKRENRANHTKYNPYDYALADGRHIGFRPAYMLDFMQYFKMDHCYFLDGKQAFTDDEIYKGPLYFYNEEQQKIGVLLPVHLEIKEEADNMKDKEIAA